MPRNRTSLGSQICASILVLALLAGLLILLCQGHEPPKEMLRWSWIRRYEPDWLHDSELMKDLRAWLNPPSSPSLTALMTGSTLGVVW